MERAPSHCLRTPAVLGVLAAIALSCVVLTSPSTADARQPHPRGRDAAVVAWASRYARPIATVDPDAPLDDLAPLKRAIGDATVVGLGESTHGAAEVIALKHRTLRLLVAQLGFRTVAWEEDWTTGLEIDAYIRGGPGDLTDLVGRMSPQYQSAQVADVLRWLRAFNAGRADQVHFVGVEHYFTRVAAYDAVEAYIASAAPELLGELRAHLQPIRPTSPDPFEHIAAYTAVVDKQPYLDHAHAVRDLVERVAHDPDDAAHAIGAHNARQIVSFYEHHGLPLSENVVYRDARAAENVRWWQNLTGDRVAYWAASAHTANAPELRIAQPPEPDLRFASAGSYLRRWYGDAYRSVGFTVDHGAVDTGSGQTAALAPPSAAWFEHPLGQVDHAQFLLDLRHRAPRAVRHWLHQPVTTRGLPDAGSDAVIDGGTLRQWFDVLVHRQNVSPATN